VGTKKKEKRKGARVQVDLCVCENQGTNKTGEKEIYENGKRTVSSKFINIEDVNQTLAFNGSQQSWRAGEEEKKKNSTEDDLKVSSEILDLVHKMFFQFDAMHSRPDPAWRWSGAFVADVLEKSFPLVAPL